jgi:hypothetical protein
LARTEVVRVLSQTRDYTKPLVLDCAGAATVVLLCILRDIFAHFAVKKLLPQRSQRSAAKFAKRARTLLPFSAERKAYLHTQRLQLIHASGGLSLVLHSLPA